MTTEESGEGEAPKSAAYHEWAMLLILAAYDNNNVSGLTALKYAGDYQRGARAGGGGATLIVRASPSNPGWLFTLSRCDVPPPPPPRTATVTRGFGDHHVGKKRQIAGRANIASRAATRH